MGWRQRREGSSGKIRAGRFGRLQHHWLRIEERVNGTRDSGMWRFALLEMRCAGYAPGGAAACGIVPATVPPDGLPCCLQLKLRSELRFVSRRPIVRTEIATVGHADLRHVIIALAPCIIAAAACDVSSSPSASCVLWFFFGAADEKHRRRYANATLQHGRPLDPRA